MNSDCISPSIELTSQQVRRLFERIGFAALSVSLVPTLVQLVVAFLWRWLLPHTALPVWGSHLLSFLSIYGAGFGMAFLFLRALPICVPARVNLRPLHWLGLLCVCMACIFLGNAVSQVMTNVLGAILRTPVKNPLSTLLSKATLWENLIFVGLLGPILEELFFRRFFCRRFLFLGDTCAIFLSAAIFALAHGNFYQIFYAFATGAVFAFVYVKTGRLRYTVAIHVYINLTGGVLVSFLSQNSNLSSLFAILGEEPHADLLHKMLPMLPYFTAMLLYAILYYLTVTVGIVLICLYAKHIRLSSGAIRLPLENNGRYMLLNSGMILCLSYYALTLIRSVLPS